MKKFHILATREYISAIEFDVEANDRNDAY